MVRQIPQFSFQLSFIKQQGLERPATPKSRRNKQRRKRKEKKCFPTKQHHTAAQGDAVSWSGEYQNNKAGQSNTVSAIRTKVSLELQTSKVDHDLCAKPKQGDSMLKQMCKQDQVSLNIITKMPRYNVKLLVMPRTMTNMT